jgi:cell division protein FtsI/penicillin-binding protein 2
MMATWRARILLLALSAWAVLVVVRHGYFALHARDRLLAGGADMAWRRGVIPAPRGRIVDRAGQPLAWTERQYDLWLERLPEQASRQRRLGNSLAELFGGDPPRLALSGCLRRNLTPTQINALAIHLSRYPELRVVPRFPRIAVDYAAVRQRIGDVAVLDDRGGIGISGWEREHEVRLRGCDGEYLVMCDRLGNWLPGTWREVTPMVPGEDVVVDATLAELLEQVATPEGEGR